MPPHDSLFASAPPASVTTDTLDLRVRRLEHILTMSARDVGTPGGQDDDAALKQFVTVLRSVQQLTDEVRFRIGTGAWDVGDALAARLLLDALTSALRNCRAVSNRTTSRLLTVDRAVQAGHNFIRRESASRPAT